MKNSVLIIYTGGTIGMKKDPVTNALSPFDLEQLMIEVPELSKFDINISTYTFDPIIDSSDVQP
ncbi:MAG: asparaginase domain-containing protein, partial [Rikenellaceae bacterium]